MCVVEFIEVHLQRARQRAVRLTRAGRVDMDGEILTGRLAEQCQSLIRERTSEFDWIAVRPVERSGDRPLLLLEDKLDPDALDRERPGPRDRRLSRVDEPALNRAFSARSDSLDWADAQA